MRILAEETCGLVIDVQEKLYPHIHEHENMLTRISILLEGLNALDVPVLVTEQYRKGLGPTLSAIEEKFSEMKPLEKMTFSCCDEPGFTARLNKLGRRNVIICGIETHVCVLQTTIDLLEKGYVPVVIADCVSSRKKSDKDIAVERMRQEGAIISTSESVLFELARISGTETFKSISRLVK